ncbi:MAG: DsrE/DsrF/DrsH-like family protein [Deltaproteobacteria bacterium]|nr:DsrE/DsrF/DrsH-like family protein [Deltaproteobacteria bacterium]
MNSSTAIDCRGQSCPAPILATAKAARGLKSNGGGTLEIAADDDAFPLDIRSWCRSSGSELIDLTVETDGTHRAVVRVTSGGERPAEAPRRRTPPPIPTRPLLSVAPQPVEPPAPPPPAALSSDEALDFRGQRCPEPILGLARKTRSLPPGTELELVADDPAFRLDLESWCRSAGATIITLDPEGDAMRARIRTAGGPRHAANTVRLTPPADETPRISLDGVAEDQRLPHLERQLAGVGHGRALVVVSDTTFSVELVQWAAAAGHRLLSLDAHGPLEAQLELAAPAPTTTALVPRETTVAEPAEDQCTLLVLHNDREALMAALMVAVGAAAQGMNVMMFFTFWGLNLLRGDEPNANEPAEKISWAQRMFKWMMPRGPRRQKLGQLNMGGLGGKMLGSIMKRYELMDVPALMKAAEDQGIQFVACTMSMQVMGVTKRDLAPRDNLEYGGVAAFVESAGRSRLSLTF